MGGIWCGVVWCGGVVSWKRAWSGISVSGGRIERAKRTQWRPSVRSYLTRTRPPGPRPGRHPVEDGCASKGRTSWLSPSENVPSPPETSVREHFGPQALRSASTSVREHFGPRPLGSGSRSAAQVRPRGVKLSFFLPPRKNDAFVPFFRAIAVNPIKSALFQDCGVLNAC